MTSTYAGEEILCESRRKGTYILRYLPFLIILAALAAATWVLPRFVPKAAEILARIQACVQTYLPSATPDVIATVVKVSITAVLGIVFIILLIAAIRNLTSPCLLVTEKRVCLLKNSDTCSREARIDKIDSFRLRKNSIAVYAGGRRVFCFSPVNNAKAVRDTIVLLIEGEYTGEDAYSHQEKPSACSEPETIEKPGNVLD